MRVFRISGLLMVGALVLAACSGGAGTAEPAPAKTLTLEAVDIAFTPNSLEVTAGEPVRLVLQNNGALEHDFSVMEFPMHGMAEQMGGSDHSAGHGADEPELHIAALGGQSATLEFTPSQAGTYEFWCTVAGHKEAGMVGTLVVAAP